MGNSQRFVFMEIFFPNFILFVLWCLVVFLFFFRTPRIKLSIYLICLADLYPLVKSKQHHVNTAAHLDNTGASPVTDPLRWQSLLYAIQNGALITTTVFASASA